MSTQLFDTNEASRGKGKFKSSDDFKSSLIFPSDLTDENFFPEAIKFSIYEREGISYDTLIKESSKAFEADIKRKSEIKELAKNEKIQREEGEKASKSILNNIRTSKAKINESIDTVNNVASAAFDSGTRQTKKPKSPVERHKQSIYLHMPQTVSFSEGIEWQGSDLGVVGGMLKGEYAEAAKSGAVSSVGALLGGAAGGLISAILGGSGLLGATVGGLIGNDGVQGGLESKFNIKANPYKEQTFQGVGFRPFEFQFTMRARNQNESFVIRDIVQAFRAYSKPSFAQDGKSGVFRYPHEFRVEFLTVNGGEYVTNQHIPEIKYCICTSVATNFTGGGSWKSFSEGAPTDVQLSLSFQETEIITEEDVMGDTKVGRFKNEEGYF